MLHGTSGFTHFLAYTVMRHEVHVEIATNG